MLLALAIAVFGCFRWATNCNPSIFSGLRAFYLCMIYWNRLSKSIAHQVNVPPLSFVVGLFWLQVPTWKGLLRDQSCVIVQPQSFFIVCAKVINSRYIVWCTNSSLSSEREKLSPFTKVFRGEGQFETFVFFCMLFEHVPKPEQKHRLIWDFQRCAIVRTIGAEVGNPLHFKFSSSHSRIMNPVNLDDFIARNGTATVELCSRLR